MTITGIILFGSGCTCMGFLVGLLWKTAFPGNKRPGINGNKIKSHNLNQVVDQKTNNG